MLKPPQEGERKVKATRWLEGCQEMAGLSKGGWRGPRHAIRLAQMG